VSTVGVLTGLCLLGSMVLTGAIAWRGVRAAGIALVLQAAVWTRVDKAFEGPHLVSVAPSHGVVAADLVAAAAVAFAAWAWLREPAITRVNARQGGSKRQ
jgi:hypothetical protein